MVENIGELVQIIGPVLDIRFSDHLPRLYSAIRIPFAEGFVTAEVEQHIGDDKVRCIAMDSTDGLMRGLPCYDTGEAIQVPVGQQVLGRMFNLLGEPIDGLGEISEDVLRQPIHKNAPSFMICTPIIIYPASCVNKFFAFFASLLLCTNGLQALGVYVSTKNQ